MNILKVVYFSLFCFVLNEYLNIYISGVIDEQQKKQQLNQQLWTKNEVFH